MRKQQFIAVIAFSWMVHSIKRYYKWIKIKRVILIDKNIIIAVVEFE